MQDITGCVSHTFVCDADAASGVVPGGRGGDGARGCNASPDSVQVDGAASGRGQIADICVVGLSDFACSGVSC